MEPTCRVELANGLIVSFYNHSHRYFGDYHRVRVEIVCEIPVLEGYFDSRGQFEEARVQLGEKVLFRRIVEKMGVPSAELDRSLESITRQFRDNSLAYLASPGFPRRAINREMGVARQAGRRTYKG